MNIKVYDIHNWNKPLIIYKADIIPRKDENFILNNKVYDVIEVRHYVKDIFLPSYGVPGISDEHSIKFEGIVLAVSEH